MLWNIKQLKLQNLNSVGIILFVNLAPGFEIRKHYYAINLRFLQLLYCSDMIDLTSDNQAFL